MTPDEGWVGADEVASHLRVAKESIYRWVEAKGFPAHRVGRLLRFKLSEVDKWVTSQSEPDLGAGRLVRQKPGGKKKRGGV